VADHDDDAAVGEHVDEARRLRAHRSTVVVRPRQAS
jgi:hypothetical protein